MNANTGIYFNFAPGRVLARKYEVVTRVGARPSGELYMLSERATGIERTARFFSPTADPKNRFANCCALRLHKLRHCDILLQYRTQETISVDGRDVTFLVSDFVNGQPLRQFLAREPGGRLSAFAGLHLLHAIATGVEKIHAAQEAHGELSIDTLMIRRRGLGFHVKVLELSPDRLNLQEAMSADVFNIVRIFYEAIGGAKAYPRHPAPVKSICLGMRRAQILARFRHAGDLRRYLENVAWS